MKFQPKIGLAIARAGVFSCALTFAVQAAPEPEKAPLAANLRLESLEVRASKIAYEAGEPVYLDVSLVNKSAQAAAFLMLGPRLEFEVKRENKKVILTYQAKTKAKATKSAIAACPSAKNIDIG